MKSEFLTEMCLVVHQDNDEVWVLKEPLVYQSEHLNCRVTVPAGFHTDLASVPRLPLIWLLWGYRSHREAVVHDYLYRTNAHPGVTYYAANRVFFEAMAARGKKWTVKYPMYFGVVLGGWTAFRKYTVDHKFGEKIRKETAKEEKNIEAAKD